MGELALVDSSSRVGESGLTFMETLLDENATCHLAWGAGLPPGVPAHLRTDDPARLDAAGVNTLCGMMINGGPVVISGGPLTSRSLWERCLMALPVMTVEQRAKALAKAGEARTARRALLAEVACGAVSVAEVFERSGQDLVGRTRVVQVLRAVPGYGPARVAALMAACGVEEKQRVGALNEQQRERLLRSLIS
ncbi:integration host factor, actinobacterial type [Nonomuraea sp. NPDC052265]|uniref:integration host factor, actinobacterial type n=1 Tax=Nonomuraea sp. NPDC052265 TaxID=3364374 RepID=UPI0037CBF5DE